MTLIDYCMNRFEYQEGAACVLMVRPLTVATIRIFGSGKTRSNADFRPVSEIVAAIHDDIRRDVGPCTRHDVVSALHLAAERQAKAKAQARREAR